MTNSNIEYRSDELYNSIGGWLIPFGIILTLSVFLNIFSLVTYFKNWYVPEFWNMLSEILPNDSSYFRNSFFIVFSLKSLIFLFQVSALIAFFIKSKKTPMLIISLQIVSIAAVAIFYFHNFLSDVDLPYQGTILVWLYPLLKIIVISSVIAYFSMSKRVKGTFVR
ncbi:DUF2569 family protein [Wukongibacter baidiensis]|uniref:DUF2569 family protein n=1 Tax=Wukongibacter baidiensis TaxID=1723361 RepID=UPI003D7FEF39